MLRFIIQPTGGFCPLPRGLSFSTLRLPPAAQQTGARSCGRLSAACFFSGRLPLFPFRHAVKLEIADDARIDGRLLPRLPAAAASGDGQRGSPLPRRGDRFLRLFGSSLCSP